MAKTWHQQGTVAEELWDFSVAEACGMHSKYQMEQPGLKPKSIDWRECTIHKHIGEHPLGRMQIKAVKVADIDNHVTGLIQAGQLSASSIEKVVDVLNSAYNWAIMRCGEMLALCWKDVDMQGGYLTIEKAALWLKTETKTVKVKRNIL